MNWQTIDSAPLDGSIVMVADRDSVCPAYFAGKSARVWRNWFKGCNYELHHLGTDCFLPDKIWFEPTHWMPFPEPPL